ncbi:hypothetical protein [Mycolicibacterium poriferae]|nr:hypothetical protein [Mycolicibacterium poriferae]
MTPERPAPGEVLAYVAGIAVWAYGPREGDELDAALPVRAEHEADR